MLTLTIKTTTINLLKQHTNPTPRCPQQPVNAVQCGHVQVQPQREPSSAHGEHEEHGAIGVYEALEARYQPVADAQRCQRKQATRINNVSR